MVHQATQARCAYIWNFPVSFTLILLLAALKLDILLPLVAVVLVLVVDKGDGDVGDSIESIVGVRWTDKSFWLFSFLLATRTMSSYVTGADIGDGPGRCGASDVVGDLVGDVVGRVAGGADTTVVISPAVSSGSSMSSLSGRSTMLSLEGEVGTGRRSVDGDKKAWFILGMLRFFIRLRLRATPLKICVGVFGVLGRSSSSTSFGSWRVSNEYKLPLA
jgi:hypothetical protein